MDTSDLDIPDFLRRQGPAAARGARTSKAKPARLVMPRGTRKPRPQLPKTMTPEAWALLAEIEAEAKRKRDQRLAALRARHAGQKRQRRRPRKRRTTP